MLIRFRFPDDSSNPPARRQTWPVHSRFRNFPRNSYPAYRLGQEDDPLVALYDQMCGQAVGAPVVF